MKFHSILICAVLSLFFVSSCGKPTHESVTEDGLEVIEEMTEILNSVKDESSAKAAAKKLDKLVDRMQKIKKQKDELGEPSEELNKELKSKYEERSSKAMKEFFAAIMKLNDKPGLTKHLEDSMKRMEDL